MNWKMQHIKIGKCYEKLENWDLAINYYNRILNSSDPKSTDSKAKKSNPLYRIKKWSF